MSNQRCNILLYGSYERAFLSKAIQNGFATPINIPDEELEVTDIAEWEYERLYKRLPMKTAVLQMFLIYDKVILVGTNELYDTEKLRGTGFVDVVSIHDEPGLVGSQEWSIAAREHAMHLKPFLLDRLVKVLSQRDKVEMRRYGLTGRQFFSTFYDISFSPDREALADLPCDKVVSFINQNTRTVYSRQKPKWDNKRVRPETAMDWIRYRWTCHVAESAGSLMTLLEKTVLLDAALMQSQFSIGRTTALGVAEDLRSGPRTLDAYGILRSCYEEAIGELPKLRSLKEVLQLKERRANDISRLRSVLSEIEHCLEHGETTTAKLAMRSIRKAARDLTRGTTASKVSRWATYLSLPIGIIEACLALPPVAGITFASVGAASTLTSDVVKSKNKWLQVVR